MIHLPTMISQWAAQPSEGKRVVAFGSSNTALRVNDLGRYNWTCWLTLAMRVQAGPHISITNAGIGGETIHLLLKRFERDVLPHNPHMVIITIGGNDSHHMWVRDYRRDMNKLVKLLLDRNILPVIQTYYSVLYKPPFDPFDQYMAAAVEVAKENDIPCIDNYAIMHPWHLSEPDKYEEIMEDPGHLNSLGHALFASLTIKEMGLDIPPMPSELTDRISDISKSLR